jgi:hypothetical protein
MTTLIVETPAGLVDHKHNSKKLPTAQIRMS